MNAVVSDSLREKVTEALFWMKRSDADFDSARAEIVSLIEAEGRAVAAKIVERMEKSYFGDSQWGEEHTLTIKDVLECRYGGRRILRVRRKRFNRKLRIEQA